MSTLSWIVHYLKNAEEKAKKQQLLPLATALSYLCAIRSDPVQSSGGAVQEADDLQEVVISDTPGAVNQEDEVRFGSLTDCTKRGRRWGQQQTEERDDWSKHIRALYVYIFSLRLPKRKFTFSVFVFDKDEQIKDGG